MFPIRQRVSYKKGTLTRTRRYSDQFVKEKVSHLNLESVWPSLQPPIGFGNREKDSIWNGNSFVSSEYDKNQAMDR